MSPLMMAQIGMKASGPKVPEREERPSVADLANFPTFKTTLLH